MKYDKQLLPIILLCIVMLSVIGCTDAAKVEHEKSVNTPVKVMTFNIRYGTAEDGDNRWQYRDKMVCGYIERQDADVFGLQEALDFQVEEIAGAVDKYSYISVGRNDGKLAGEHCSIFYKKDRFKLVETETFWLSNTPRVPGSKSWGNNIPRICTWVKLVEKQTQHQLYVFNIHMDHRSQMCRLNGNKLLAKKLATLDNDAAVIVLGDFNMPLDNEAMVLLQEKLVDTWKKLNPDNLNLRTWHDFKGGIEGYKIDHILVEPSAKILETQIDRYNENGRYPSDHYPITTTLKLW